MERRPKVLRHERLQALQSGTSQKEQDSSERHDSLYRLDFNGHLFQSSGDQRLDRRGSKVSVGNFINKFSFTFDNFWDFARKRPFLASLVQFWDSGLLLSDDLLPEAARVE
jgi:hypothetical protein